MVNVTGAQPHKSIEKNVKIKNEFSIFAFLNKNPLFFIVK
jgi:hypothetical protein